MALNQVIFIGGTSFSGSTFFDMMLANDPKGFSCGEVYALFHPHRPHHYNILCGCGVKNCGIWEKVHNNGENRLFGSLAEIDPGIEFIVASAKQTFWQTNQMSILDQDKIRYKNILIWKDPYEFASSSIKRGRTNWEKDWVNYHRLYFTNIKRWKSVRYKDVAQKKGTLEKICEYLEIPFFDDKHNFWNKTHHTLFGNQSAKIHLVDKTDDKFEKIKNELEKDGQSSEERIETDHKSIYYNPAINEELKARVEDRIGKNPLLRDIVHQLEDNDIFIPGHNNAGIHKLFYSKQHSNLRKANYLMTTAYRDFISHFKTKK